LRTAVIISFVFHAVVIASTMIVLPKFNRDRETKMRVIPVEMVKIGDVTKLKSQEKEPEPVKKKTTPPKKKPPERKVEMPPEPPKLASTMPLPDLKAKPKKEPQKVAPKPRQTAASRAPKVTPRSKPSRFSAAALLNKLEQAEPDIVEKLRDRDYGAEKVLSELELQQQTLSIIDAIDKHIFDNQCWNVPAGAKGAEDLRVTVHIRLTPEGRLVGAPKVLESARMNMPGEEFFRTAAESALRAVRKCAPYDFLPKDKYDIWRDMDIIFDPEQMLNG